MKIKNFLSFILCLSLIISLFPTLGVYGAESEYPLLSGNYVRLLGRGEVIGNSRCFNWPNAGFEFEFSGSAAEVFADEIQLGAYTDNVNGSFFNVAVYDGDTLVRVNRVKLNQGWNTIYEEQIGDPSLKKIMLVRSSEACRGIIRMSKLRTDATPCASSPRAKLIEFIGDSYTAGFGNSIHLSSAKDYYCAENTDNWNSYTGMVARHYNADSNVIAYQGKGVYKNVNKTTAHTMSHQFEYEEIHVDTNASSIQFSMSTLKKHKFYKYQPQLVSIWLGTNDALAGNVTTDIFKTAYAELLDNVRAKYPNASILCIALKNSKYLETIKDVATDDKRGEANKFYTLELNNFTSQTLDHPDVAEDERIAKQIIDKIDSIENIWNVPLVGEGDTALMSIRADYNTGKIAVFGNTGYGNDFVSLKVMEPDASESDLSETSKIAFIAQRETTSGGEYAFEFIVDKLSGEYAYYLNTYSMRDLNESQFVFKNVIPKMDVTSGGKTVKKMDDISSGKDIKVILSGFDVPDEDFAGMLALAQYSGGVLETVELADASKDSQAYGDEVVLNTTVNNATDSIRVFYMNKNTLAPLFGTYDIK